MISYEIERFGKPLVRAMRDAPVPQGAELLLKTVAAGVCHTDVHTRSGGYDLGGGRSLRMADRGVQLPLTLGHEIVGTVAAVGPDADPALLGRTFLVYPWMGCGGCAICRTGAENMCLQPRSLGIFRNGGYSDHVLVTHQRYLIDVGALTPEAAAPLACSGLTTYSALRRIPAAVLAAHATVIIGAGGLGLMAIRLLAAMGAAAPVVVDIDDSRLAAAMAAGAKQAVDGRKADAVAAVREAAGDQVLAVLDLVGSVQTAEQGLAVLSKGGRLLVVGLAGGELRLALPLLPLRAITIEGCYVGTLPELRELVALVRTTRLPQLPTTCRPLAEAEAALDDLEAGRVIGRTILRP